MEWYQLLYRIATRSRVDLWRLVDTPIDEQGFDVLFSMFFENVCIFCFIFTEDFIGTDAALSHDDNSDQHDETDEKLKKNKKQAASGSSRKRQPKVVESNLKFCARAKLLSCETKH
jgi:hypothetical protein